MRSLNVRHSLLTVPRSCCDVCGGASLLHAVKLKCGHWMCISCLRRVINASVTGKRQGPQPQSCCTRNATRLFDCAHVNIEYSELREISIGEGLYCPFQKCGAWIPPEYVAQGYDDVLHAVCLRCHNRLCFQCGRKWLCPPHCPRGGRKTNIQKCPQCALIFEIADRTETSDEIRWYELRPMINSPTSSDTSLTNTLAFHVQLFSV